MNIQENSKPKQFRVSNFLGFSIPEDFQTNYEAVRAYVDGYDFERGKLEQNRFEICQRFFKTKSKDNSLVIEAFYSGQILGRKMPNLAKSK